MTDNTFDVIVVGVGAMGSAACYALAKAGARVLGLEQFAIPHDLGSSHGGSRMIRLYYYEHPDFVPLLRRAYAAWREAEAESGQRVLTCTGGLYFSRPEDELVAGSLRSARENDLPHELLSREEIGRRYPQFTPPDDVVGLYEPSAGYLRPEACISMYTDLAVRHGARVHGHEPVTAWSADAHGVTVTTPRETYRAGRIVFTSGAWTSRLVRDLGVPLRVTRQVQGWVQPQRPEWFGEGDFPVWAYADGAAFHYGFPLIAGMPGLKVAEHSEGDPTTPETVDRTPSERDHQTFRGAIRRLLPAADGPLVAMRVCLYTNSPDHFFILDRLPGPHSGLVTVACGFSGHGFKFASVVGEILRDLALRGHTDLPIDFLRLSRFARG